VHRLNHDFDSALTDYDRLINLYPFMEIGYVGKGRILMDRGDYQAAQAFYADAIQRFPSNHRISYSLGILKAREGDWNESLALFDRIARTSPRNLRARLGMIRVLNRMNQPERALSVAEDLLSLAPTHRQALNEKAAALFALGRFQEAFDFASVRDVRTEAEWGAAFIGAMSLDAMGRTSEAETMLRWGVSSPINRVRRYVTAGLAVLKLKANNLNGARQIIESASGEASAVVRLHIAAQSRLPSALAEYRQGVNSDIALYAEVKEQIVRRFRLVADVAGPVSTREWLFEAEARLLVLDAANDDYMLQAAA
jgi:tetratricopeptide (TPR) repeat protein